MYFVFRTRLIKRRFTERDMTSQKIIEIKNEKTLRV
jgi:hypothetical protein